MYRKICLYVQKRCTKNEIEITHQATDSIDVPLFHSFIALFFYKNNFYKK